jgi:hypothetical protein
VASGATEFMDTVTEAVFIKTVWSKRAQVAREKNLVFAKLSNRVYEQDARMGGAVNVPNISDLTANTKNTSSNAAVVFETVTETSTQITIGTWVYNGIALETATEVQVDRDLLEAYAPKQGYALALKVDDDLAALPDDLTTNIVGTLGVELDYDTVLEARQKLLDNDVPLEDVAIIIAPAQETGFMKLDKFINNDYNRIQGEKTALANVDRAFIGSWLGIPIYRSTNVEGSNATGHDNVMFHKEAFALVMQMRPRTHTWFDINYLARKVVVEQLYGLKTMRDNHAVWMKGA